MESFLKDLRVAARQLVHHKGLAAVVVVTLGLAIGVNTLTFSFVNFFAFRPLPLKDVSRLVVIYGRHPEHGRDRARATYADYVEWREQSTSFEDLGAGGTLTVNLTGSGDPMRLRAFVASASLLSEWGLAAVAGRVLQADDDRRGAPPVVMLSHGFWSRQFGADPRVVGTSLRIDGRSCLVVGVLTPAIEIGTLSEIDVWLPLTPAADPADRATRTLLVSGRLKPGVELSRAAAEIQAIVARQERDHSDTNAGWSAYVLPIRSALSGTNTRVILILMAVAVSLVLAIACANVANLMLARAVDRRREIALRVALGAARGRVVRQLLTESLLLAVAGGALGVLLASSGLAFIRSVTYEPFFVQVVIDRRVAAFSAVIALLSPLLFGLVPALQATRVDLVTALKEAGAAVGASRRRVLGRNLLVSAQLALALSLLLVAGLVVRAAIALRQLQLGFDHHQILTMKTELPEGRYKQDAQVRAFVGQLEARLRGVPGVQGVATAAGRPVFEPGASQPLAIDSVGWSEHQARPLAVQTVVGAGYFETLRIRIVKGRAFGSEDRPGTELTAVVNETLAARHFAGLDPLGRRVRLGAAGAPWRTIVGVAADVLNTEPGQPALAQVYLPLDQEPTRTLAFLVKTASTDATVTAARREVAALDPEQPLYDVKTMEQALFEGLASDRVIMGMFVLFASVALGLAVLGLYSLMSYAVSQRTREIAVRVALGARQTDVLTLVVRQGATLLLAGVGPGLLLGLGFGRMLTGILAGVSPTDATTFILVPLILGAVGLLATVVPARRAAGVQPATLLRSE
jgi:putative ABC transport system permease protein